MANVSQDAVLHHLGQLFDRGTVTGLSEWQLLSRYLEKGDELAFETLVMRHGPMVLGVCRRLLADPNDADDAFQATFLVLVRKASSLSERDAIGHWLYGVAHRVALHARSRTARRQGRESNVAPTPPPLVHDTTGSQFELGPILDEELSRLPSKYRAPLVLCYLEGLTHEETARQLRWPIGTVKGRLSRARELLKRRLIRRGLGLSAALAITRLERTSAAVVPELLRSMTVATAMNRAIGPIRLGLVSTSVATLMEGVFTSMFWSQIRTVAVAMLTVGFLATTVAVVAQHPGAERGNALSISIDPTDAAKSRKVETEEVSSAVTDNPSHPSANAETTLETRSAGENNDLSPAVPLSKLASKLFQDELIAYGRTDPTGAKLSSLIRWSKAIAEEPGQMASQQIEALKAHRSRIRDLRQLVLGLEPAPSTENLLAQAQYYEQEADQSLAQAMQKNSGPLPGSNPGDQPADQDPASQSVLAMLNQPIDMDFPDETPLEDVLKYIEAVTTPPGKSQGIPIYVDPAGLEASDKTMTSPVRLALHGMPLRTTFKLMLKQLGLTYKVKEGLLIISNEESVVAESPLSLLEQKAELGALTPEESAKLIEMLKTINEIKKLKAEGRRLDADVSKLQDAQKPSH